MALTKDIRTLAADAANAVRPLKSLLELVDALDALAAVENLAGETEARLARAQAEERGLATQHEEALVSRANQLNGVDGKIAESRLVLALVNRDIEAARGDLATVNADIATARAAHADALAAVDSLRSRMGLV